MVASLLVSFYGTRAAAMNWTAAYTNFALSIGFEKGSGCQFRDDRTRKRFHVHREYEGSPIVAGAILVQVRNYGKGLRTRDWKRTRDPRPESRAAL